MEISKKLKEQGWHLTDEGLKKVIAAAAAPAADTSDIRKIIAAATDMDFREIAAGALPTKREDTIPGRIVLQIQKIRNISAPKSNEDSKAAPRFLQVELSDGQAAIQALELENIPALSLNVPPGTKVYLRSERLQLMQGFLVLRAAELQVLGGRVEALVEKWEVARTMQKYARSGRRMSGPGGPPPWIAFGKKLDTPLANERNFKSLQAGEKDKESKENEEFNAMRSEAIAVASKAGAKKVFGGGGVQILDHNVKKILEKGYSEEEAQQALRATNNNLERALYNLKRRQDYKKPEESSSRGAVSAAPLASTKPVGRGPPTREFGGGKRGMASAKEEASAAKPATNVSLFDFLTDKLPAEATSSTTNNPFTSSSMPASTASNTNTVSGRYDKSKSEAAKPSYGTNSKPPTTDASARPKFENNISSSFAANRSSAPRGSRGGSNVGGGRGGRGNATASYTPREAGNDRSGPRSSNSNSNSSFNVQGGQGGGRGNRHSHERSSAPSSGAGQQENSGSGYNSRRGNDQQQQNRSSGDRYGGYGDNKGQRYNRSDNNNRQHSSSNNNSNHNANDNNNSAINKLTEATSKMRIDNKGRSEQSSTGGRISGGGGSRHQSQQQQPPKSYQQNAGPNYGQQQQQQQQPSSFGTQLPNGFTYDPSKIIGFQSKETNEFAMTMLKSQGLAPGVAPAQQQQQQPPEQQRQAAAPMPTHHPAYVPAAVSPMPPAAAHSPYAAPPTTYVLPNPPAMPAVAPIPSQFGMMPGDGWMWKIGDLCLAKYWDDGRYYEAEITAVSDKTCVVFFLGYGNHEEVLKSDCLPITDANHRPINNYNAPPQMAPPPQMQPNSFQRGGGSQRYRGERQVYVPPHKRDN